ncbi:transmembrane protein 177 [Lepisosteus oculatus]|uniref:transmembrane protein 177 n=1 Tax=Lepisosteus oculatus TaxID=7918 RepID=UPI0035F51BBF
MAGRLARKLALFVQRHRTGLLVGSCAGAFSVQVLHHVFPEQTYRKLHQAWSKGEPASLPETLRKTFQDVLRDAGVRDPRKYSAFAAFGFHPVGAGLPWLPAGARIGVPAHFDSTADAPAGISDRVILINGEAVRGDGSPGRALRESLVLSPAAQRFAIGREVARLQGGGPVLLAAVAPAGLALTCLCGVAVKQLLGLYAGPVLLRGLANAAVLTVGAAGYCLVSDAVGQWLDYRWDRRAASLSTDYATGGVEFYNKLLARNVALRGLMGRKGEEMFAPSGNLFPSSWFRLQRAPYTARRDSIVGLLKEQKA